MLQCSRNNIYRSTTMSQQLYWVPHIYCLISSLQNRLIHERLSHFIIDKNWGTEKLNNFLKVTLLVTGLAAIQPQVLVTP